MSNIFEVFVHDRPAGIFEKLENGRYVVRYYPGYVGPPISLTMPLKQKIYEFESFPAFFDAFLPEGPRLEAFLQKIKLDREDYFGQLMHMSGNLVGAVHVRKLTLRD